MPIVRFLKDEHKGFYEKLNKRIYIQVLFIYEKVIKTPVQAHQDIILQKMDKRLNNTRISNQN